MRMPTTPWVMLLALAGPVLARADLITLTESITTDGSLGGTAFTGKLVTLTFTVDTSGVVPFQGSGYFQYAATASSATVTIAGVGTSAFTDSLGVKVQTYPTFSAFLVADPGNSADVLDTFATASGFAGVDLTRSFGPVSGGASSSTSTPFSTSGGAFLFTRGGGGVSSVSGVLSAVPEPASLVMLGLGGLGLGLGLGRRGRRPRAEPA